MLRDPQPGKDPSTTPTGEFRIFKKRPGKHMGDGKLTASLDAFEFPGVPWVSYYQAAGFAVHGAYWHNDFGRRRSHGCVNMRPAEARWIYRWTAPAVPLERQPAESEGTTVRVFE
jgi:lipoprotein-anchoring transpeptidase ErfK/SrfK